MPDDGRIQELERNPFVDANAPTFADVIARITADADLAPARRRDLVSSMRCLMRLLDLDPATTPANVGALRERLGKVHPAPADISEKRFANIKSDVRFALRHLGPPAPSSIRHEPRTKSLHNPNPAAPTSSRSLVGFAEFRDKTEAARRCCGDDASRRRASDVW